MSEKLGTYILVTKDGSRWPLWTLDRLHETVDAAYERLRELREMGETASVFRGGMP